MPRGKFWDSRPQRKRNHTLILRYIYAITGLIIAITGLLALFTH